MCAPFFLKPQQLDGATLEKLYVHEVYNTIAHHFSHTRYAVSLMIKAFTLAFHLLFHPV